MILCTVIIFRKNPRIIFIVADNTMKMETNW